MPNIGQFVLHSQANPPLKAGDYVLHGRQDIAERARAEPYDGHVRVDRAALRAARRPAPVDLPAGQQRGRLREPRCPRSSSSAARCRGSARPSAGRRTTTPWLALVVIAEGEGTLSGDDAGRAVRDARGHAARTRRRRDRDLPVGPETVVDKVFPTAEDLPLLVPRARGRRRRHRAGQRRRRRLPGRGASANRLPQYDRDGRQAPVRYLACLVNLEGQLDVLPRAERRRSPRSSWPPSSSTTCASTRRPGRRSTPTLRHGRRRRRGAVRRAGRRPPRRRRAPRCPPPIATRGAWPPSPRRPPRARRTTSQWSTAQARVEQAALSADQEEAGRVVRDVMLEGFRDHVEHASSSSRSTASRCSPTGRSPCTGSGGFQPLMQSPRRRPAGHGARGT